MCTQYNISCLIDNYPFPVCREGREKRERCKEKYEKKPGLTFIYTDNTSLLFSQTGHVQFLQHATLFPITNRITSSQVSTYSCLLCLCMCKYRDNRLVHSFFFFLTLDTFYHRLDAAVQYPSPDVCWSMLRFNWFDWVLFFLTTHEAGLGSFSSMI